MDGYKDRFRDMIRESGLTCKEIARRAGVSPQAVSAWQTGARTPKRPTAKTVAEALGFSVESLYEHDEAEGQAEARGDGVTLRALLEHERREARGDDDGQAGATDEKEGAAMVTFNDLLALVEVDVIELVFQLTERLSARATIQCHDMAQVDDATRLYGERRVKRFTPAFHGDERMVVWLV